MLETISMRAGLAGAGTSSAAGALQAGWRDGLAVVNLRGDAADGAFRSGVEHALGVALPVAACMTNTSELVRVVWAGPDDWFVIGPKGQADAIVERLRAALAGLHHAVTDVSSGYTVLHLAGRPAREVLAQGCPLDLHPRAFAPGQAAGSHWFKASIWLWQIDTAPTYEALVRRSFMGYVLTLLQRTTQECGLVTRRFV